MIHTFLLFVFWSFYDDFNTVDNFYDVFYYNIILTC